MEITNFLSERVGFLIGKTIGRVRKNFLSGYYEERFGIYKEDVDDFIECIQVRIPEVNEAVLKIASLNKQHGVTPDYEDYLNISPNFKKLTKNDYMKTALHNKYYFVFDILVFLYKGSIEFEEGKDDALKFTKNSHKAASALTSLRPDGITMTDFVNIIKEVDHATSSIRDGYRKRS